MFPAEGGAGYKALDGMSFGMTEEQQKLRIRVATEEEIARTLKQFEAVESAKVHLVSAERSFTRRDSSPAKASVILRIKAGRVLDPGAADAMTRLVSNAAPGLLATNVIITDTQGNLLSRGGEEAIGSGAFNQTRARERWLQEKAQTALDAALGLGRAVVRVDADIELDRVETRKEEVKPESKVVTKERISSSTSSTGRRPRVSLDLGHHHGGVGIERGRQLHRRSRIGIRLRPDGDPQSRRGRSDSSSDHRRAARCERRAEDLARHGA
jgi:flagellar M-ring protein FliF